MSLLFRLVGLAVLLYGLGFAVFMALLPAPRAGVPAVAGLVVFTGGSGRVATALEALEEGYDGPVLISGVYPGARIVDVAPELAPELATQLELDPLAASTRDNVRNTAAWAARHQLDEIGVITSTYHALRVRLLFAWLAPQVNVVLIPVQPPAAGLRAMFREYNKLLLLPVLH
jgi:uncharacterized SAM-binding protein YcdF (DUF218 family)